MSGTKPWVSHLHLSLSSTVSVSCACHCSLLVASCLFVCLFDCLLLQGQCALVEFVARLLLYCVDRKKLFLALGCRSLGPECGLVFLVFSRFRHILVFSFSAAIADQKLNRFFTGIFTNSCCGL